MDNFQEQVLYVGEVNDDVNLNELPATGEEYIKRVILEARQCQEVVVKNFDDTRTKKQTIIEMPSTINDTPGYLMPTKEWQDIQIKDFSNVRMHLAEIRSKRELTPQLNKRPEIDLPDINDQNSWLKLCLGNEEGSYVSPKLNLILSLSQPVINKVLEYLISHVQRQNEISHNIGRWIYALLVSLELPLDPDTCSSLRTLARCCHKIRISLNSVESPDINIYNLFICLVAKYFRQLDLADE